MHHSPMASPPKDIDENDVFAVYARVARSLVREGFTGFMGPGKPEKQLFFDVEGQTPRAELLYRMLKHVHYIKSRIMAAKNAAAHDAQYPDRAGLLDNASGDQAFKDLKEARKLISKAGAVFAERWQVVQRGMHPLKPLPVAKQQAEYCAVACEIVDCLLGSNTSIERFPAITMAREWDELLTDFVVDMLDQDLFSPDDCAEVIVGDREQGKAMLLRRKRKLEQKSRIA
jgi:hypothetical protein